MGGRMTEPGVQTGGLIGESLRASAGWQLAWFMERHVCGRMLAGCASGQAWWWQLVEGWSDGLDVESVGGREGGWAKW